MPHFEKMLDDNALLLRVYAHWARLGGHPLARRVTRETAAFLLAELRTPEGAFASSLDADSAGPDGAPREGAYYVWSPAQLCEVLGADDGAWAAHLLGVTDAGTFEHGTSVLQLRHEPDDPERWADVRARLRAARDRRPRPARDDKVVAAWNGLAVAALADAGVLLEEDAWVEAAVGAADVLDRVHRRGGRLVRTSRDGVAGTAPGVLADHADVVEGFLALYQATGDDRWYRAAGELLEEVLTAFGEPGHLFDTADHQADPVVARLTRPREVADGPSPSGPAAAAGALLTYAALSGSTRHREAAEQALDEPLAVGARVPRAAGWALAVAEAMLDGPREVALVDDDGTLRRVVAAATAPGLVVAPAGDVPLVADRPGRGGPTAYVCRGFVCERPTTDPVDLAHRLDPRGGR